MKNIYKILFTCIITAILVVPTTWYFAREYYTREIDTEITCKDNASPDINGCCTGEEYKDMGDQGFACCPMDGGDCFPPIVP